MLWAAGAQFRNSVGCRITFCSMPDGYRGLNEAASGHLEILNKSSKSRAAQHKAWRILHLFWHVITQVYLSVTKKQDFGRAAEPRRKKRCSQF